VRKWRHLTPLKGRKTSPHFPSLLGRAMAKAAACQTEEDHWLEDKMRGKEWGHLSWTRLTTRTLPYYLFCTKITWQLKNISDKLAKFERTNTILVGIHQKWIVFERFWSHHQNSWYCLIFNTCGEKGSFCTRCEYIRYFGLYLSWHDLTNSNKMLLKEVALFLLYLLQFSSCLCAKCKYFN